MLTRSKLPQLHEDRLEAVTLVAAGRRPPLTRWLLEDRAVPGRWPIGIGVAWWVVVATTVFALAPAPAQPQAPDPMWASVLHLGIQVALGAMAVGLILRSRLGLVASVAAGGLFLVATVMCPVSGHHESVGAWWYLQMAAFTGLVGASLVGLRRSRTPQAGSTSTAA